MAVFLKTSIHGLSSSDFDNGDHHIEIDITGSRHSLLELSDLIREVAIADKHAAHQHVRLDSRDSPVLGGDVETISFFLTEAHSY